MDSNSEDGEYQHLEHAVQHDAALYRVSYPHTRNTKQADYGKNEEFSKRRFPVCRSGNSAGRAKRVVSCKRKTHHLTVTRKKPLGSGRTYAANKENEMNSMQDEEQEILQMDPWEFSVNVNSNHKPGRTGSEQAEYSTLTELTSDHSAMSAVLFGRNLRLKVASTLLRRNVGELLAYFLRIKDTSVFVDFLPLISKSLNEDSPMISIGCCVDLFPLVKRVLTNPYEEHVIVGLHWINSVLKKWWAELIGSGYGGPTKLTSDKNFQAFNQQLLGLWHQELSFKLFPGAAGDMVKAIDSFLSQLT